MFTIVLLNPVTYILQESKGDIFKGIFYDEELTKSTVGDVYLVKRLLKTKDNNLGIDKTHISRISKREFIT